VLPGAPVTALLKITVKNVWSCYLVLLLLVQQALLPVHTNSWLAAFFSPPTITVKPFLFKHLRWMALTMLARFVLNRGLD
jgi:hypothetical protein